MDKRNLDKDVYAKEASFNTNRIARAYVFGKENYIHSIPAGF
jgi:hypothetical protein